MQAVELHGAPIDATFERYMEECVQCRGCEVACPSSVPFGHLMEGAREALDEHRRPTRPWRRRAAEWLGYRLVLPRHWLLVALSWLLAVAQRVHLVPARVALPPISLRSLVRRLRARAPTESADAFLFPGCVMDAWQRDTHRAALHVLEATGARPAPPGPGADCSVALPAAAGPTDAPRP